MSKKKKKVFLCRHCGYEFDPKKVKTWEIEGHRPHCPKCGGVAVRNEGE